MNAKAALVLGLSKIFSVKHCTFSTRKPKEKSSLMLTTISTEGIKR